MNPLEEKVFPPPDAMSFAEWISACEQLTDDGVWLLACLAIGAAGKRAARVGRDDIQEACRRFGTDMHALAGTPAPPPRWSTR